MKVSDFRSDTVTAPSARMREVMAAAEVGDDVLDGDPTVRRLEERTADWLGLERALFVPSGTMANQIAVGAWTRPGDEMIVQRWAHVITYEAGAVAGLHGVQTLTLGGIDGVLDAEQVRAAIRPDYVHCPVTTLVCLEQTHNVAGGRVAPLEELQAVARVARERGVAIHLDGARLANAVVASGVSAREWSACADSVSICLSKGLGAPVGSLVAGDGAFCERARVLRKRLGGWMRQAGIVAAAGIVALEENVERLADDHALARELARRLDPLPGISADPDGVPTNIVMVQVEREDLDAASLAAALEPHGVRALPFGERTLRFMTHLDVGPEDVQRCAAAVGEVLAR